MFGCCRNDSTDFVKLEKSLYSSLIALAYRKRNKFELKTGVGFSRIFSRGRYFQKNLSIFFQVDQIDLPRAPRTLKS